MQCKYIHNREWLYNLSILRVHDEGYYRKRVVRTKFDIYVFIVWLYKMVEICHTIKL